MKVSSNESKSRAIVSQVITETADQVDVHINFGNAAMYLTGVVENIKAGIRYARSYLETAKEIADLVSRSLGHGNRRNDKREPDPSTKFGTGNLVSGFFRLLGVDSTKIGAIVVNSAIFLAQLISSLFDLKPQAEHGRSLQLDELPDPMKFITENKNERIQRLLRQAQDLELPNQLIDRLDGFDSSCIRLLVCKSSPVIWAVQRSLTNETGHKSRGISSWLPRIEEFEDNSESCEIRHRDCELFPET
ncbi:uncharacterized protein LOC105698838 [Orussus abietinus]|uniref:uncharacterized protein LOC105698838 n=1 Tax=Orussus abietinus TaxID=222816 RepID=UPI0006269446|nr:uncharacterized protein LOC105698838 [Orussus abietinus]